MLYMALMSLEAWRKKLERAGWRVLTTPWVRL